MAEEQNEVRRVKWDEVFSFVHIFKSGWAALNFNQLGLALAAILLLYVSGRGMGLLWRLCGETARYNEICLFVRQSPGAFEAGQAKWKESARREWALSLARCAFDERKSLAGVCAAMSGLDEDVNKVFRIAQGAEASDYLPVPESRRDPRFDQAIQKVFTERLRKFMEDDKDKSKEYLTQKELDKLDWSELLRNARQDWAEALKKADAILQQGDFSADVGKALADTLAKDPAEWQAESDKALRLRVEKQARQAHEVLSRLRASFEANSKAIEGWSLFTSFTDYEGSCLQGMVRAAWRLNLTGGLDGYMAEQRARAVAPIPAPASGVGAPAPQTPAQPAEGGVIFWLLMAGQGLAWLVCRHWIFAAVLGVLTLVVWAVLGGAIYRIAALSITRGEKISGRQAVRFSVGKFFSFFSAPLILLGVIVLTGLLTLTLPALAFGNFWGGILMSLMMPLFLVFGVVIAFLSIGLLTGGGLMYPTIAVEGSDSFDGISRSFSYTFNRPARSLFYAGVAIVFGALCYLLVRLFAFVALAATHWFLAIGVIGSGESLAENADRLDKLWQAPTFLDLRGPDNAAALSGSETVAAWIVWFWVSAVAATLLAYLLTYLANASTAVYCLLRNKVDATDLDDVFIEEADESLPAPAPEPAPAPAAAPDQPPAEPTNGQPQQPK